VVEPVVNPVTMTIDKVREQLFHGFREFYRDKMKRLRIMPRGS
jgi:hypothetical protein